MARYEKSNRYTRISDGTVLGDGHGMAKLYKPKVLICKQILGISAAEIARAFGVVGQCYIDALRSEMIRELDATNIPLSSWREVAALVKGREELSGLN